MEPSVSAIVTSYNHQRYLRPAIESALSQRDVEHEVVVVDDASTDGTRELLAGLPGDKRLRIDIAERNRGVSQTFNRGLELARGEFVAFLGSDDWWLPGHLAGALDRLGREDATMVYGRVRTVDERDRENDAAGWLFGPAPRDADFFGSLLRRRNFVPFISVVVRRDTVLSAGGFDEQLRVLQDYDLWIRIASRHTVSFRDEIAGSFRWDGGNTSSPSPENSLRFRKETVRILERVLREVPEVRLRGYEAPLRKHLAAKYRQLGHRLSGPDERASCYRNSLRLDPYQPETVAKYLATRFRAGRAPG